jgi:hypothetical protein
VDGSMIAWYVEPGLRDGIDRIVPVSLVPSVVPVPSLETPGMVAMYSKSAARWLADAPFSRNEAAVEKSQSPSRPSVGAEGRSDWDVK